MMRAVRIKRTPPGATPYSSTNPAPASALEVQHDVPIPSITEPGQLIVRVKATTVIRDNLTWPELYDEHPARIGNDFSGVVATVHPDERRFKPGDEVYGMMSAGRGGAWAEYAMVLADEAHPKPARISWEEAAALPLSAMTADQALFDHGGLSRRADAQPRRVLVSGAAGGVGVYLVQFASLEGHHVVAATGSNERNEGFVRSLGAAEVADYRQIPSLDVFDVIVDTVGGRVLAQCWEKVTEGGALLTIDSSSLDFAEQHQQSGVAKAGVRAKSFIVKPSQRSMARLSQAVETEGLKVLVAKTMALEDARAAYELGNSRTVGRGKVVLTL